MNNEKNKDSFLTTAIITVIVVFFICLVLQIELYFRCDSYVTRKELNMTNLLEFATMEQLEIRLKNEPDNYFVCIKLAQMHENLGEYKQAKDLYVNALKRSGRSNYSLYNYALFCSKMKLYAISSALAEEISGMTKKNIKYKALIYESIADNMANSNMYEGAVKAYQIAYKYAKNVNDNKYVESIGAKYADAYIKLADYYIKLKRIQDAISALNNSLKINSNNDIAKYKLALLYVDLDKVKAIKLIEEVFNNDPFMVNPYIYYKLIKQLTDEAYKSGNKDLVNHYTIRNMRFKKTVGEIYLYKKDIEIFDSVVTREKNNYYLNFKVRNLTDEKISQLYTDVDLYLNSKRYNVSKKVIKLSHVLGANSVISDCKIKLPKDVDISKEKEHNYLILKYFAKKRKKAPATLIKIESLNF